MKAHSMAAIVASLAFLAGCAGPSASSGGEGLSGTWRGSFGQFGGVLYLDEADCTLDIREDRTFTARCTRSPGANNIAKPSSWSGRVAADGNRVTLQTSSGPWPWVVLTRWDAKTLYGVSIDPMVQATVMMSFERVD